MTAHTNWQIARYMLRSAAHPTGTSSSKSFGKMSQTTCSGNGLQSQQTINNKGSRKARNLRRGSDRLETSQIENSWMMPAGLSKSVGAGDVLSEPLALGLWDKHAGKERRRSSTSSLISSDNNKSSRHLPRTWSLSGHDLIDAFPFVDDVLKTGQGSDLEQPNIKAETSHLSAFVENISSTSLYDVDLADDHPCPSIAIDSGRVAAPAIKYQQPLSGSLIDFSDGAGSRSPCRHISWPTRWKSSPIPTPGHKQVNDTSDLTAGSSHDSAHSRPSRNGHSLWPSVVKLKTREGEMNAKSPGAVSPRLSRWWGKERGNDYLEHGGEGDFSTDYNNDSEAWLTLTQAPYLDNITVQRYTSGQQVLDLEQDAHDSSEQRDSTAYSARVWPTESKSLPTPRSSLRRLLARVMRTLGHHVRNQFWAIIVCGATTLQDQSKNSSSTVLKDAEEIAPACDRIE